MELTYKNLMRAYHHIEAVPDLSDMEGFNEARGVKISLDRCVNVLCFNLESRGLAVFQHIIPGVIKASVQPSPDPQRGYSFIYETRTGSKQNSDDLDIEPNQAFLHCVEGIFLQTFKGRGSVIFREIGGFALEINDHGLWIVRSHFRKSSRATYEE